MYDIQGLSKDTATAYEQGRRDGRAEGIHAVELAIHSEIRSLVSEFCELYDGDLSGEAVSLLLSQLRKLIG